MNRSAGRRRIINDRQSGRFLTRLVKGTPNATFSREGGWFPRARFRMRPFPRSARFRDTPVFLTSPFGPSARLAVPIQPMKPAPSVRSIQGGVWAVADQVVLSAANLLTCVLIGREAGPETLGQYSVGFSVTIVLSCLQRALVVNPFGIFVFRRPEAMRARMRGTLLIHAAATIGLGLGIGLVATAAMDAAWLGVALSVAVAGGMLRETARQANFAELRFASAFAIDAFSALLQVAGVLWCWRMNTWSPASLFGVLGVASLGSGLAWTMWWSNRSQFDFRDAIAAWPSTWRFGRWEAMGQSLQVVQTNALAYILALTSGFAAAGLYAAVWSIVQLVSPFAQAAGNMMGPWLSRSFAVSGIASLRRMTRQWTVASIGLGAVYVVTISILGTRILMAAYGPQYGQPQALMTLLSVVVAVSFASMAITKSITVLEQPSWIFWIQSMVLVLIIALAGGLGRIGGLEWAAAGLLAAQAIGLAAKATVYRFLAAGQPRNAYRIVTDEPSDKIPKTSRA